MTQFYYVLGVTLYSILTLWLAMLGVLFVWDILASKARHRHHRLPLNTLAENSIGATVMTVFAFVAAAVDTYLLTPTLGAGIHFFFAG